MTVKSNKRPRNAGQRFPLAQATIVVCLALTVAAYTRGEASTPPAPSARTSDPVLERELRVKDQALLDQTAPRDRVMWKATLTRDAITLDENSRMLSRDDMLNGLTDRPLSIRADRDDRLSASAIG